MKKENQNPFCGNSSEETAPLNCEQARIADWLKKVRFKKKLFGGVSESDVWKKLDELNSMYNAALIAERIRYDALLEQQKTDADAGSGNNGGV